MLRFLFVDVSVGFAGLAGPVGGLCLHLLLDLLQLLACFRISDAGLVSRGAGSAAAATSGLGIDIHL